MQNRKQRISTQLNDSFGSDEDEDLDKFDGMSQNDEEVEDTEISKNESGEVILETE